MDRSDGEGGDGMSAVCTVHRNQSNLEAKFLQIGLKCNDMLVVLSCFCASPLHWFRNCEFFAYQT